MPVLAQHISDLTDRVHELCELSGLHPDDLRNYFTSDPLSPEGREAKQKVKELAEGFFGSVDARRALVLEPARILAQHKMAEILLVWGSDRPEEYAGSGIPQEEYDRLAQIEYDIRRGTDRESIGLRRMMQERSIEAVRISGWLGDLISRDKGLRLDMIPCAYIRESRYRPAIQIVFSNRLRSIDASWWKSIERAVRIVQSFPGLRGPRIVEELMLHRWADLMVEEAVHWARKDPSTDRCAAELINELARMTQSYRITKHISQELAQGVQYVVDSAWSLIAPFTMLQAAIKELSGA